MATARKSAAKHPTAKAAGDTSGASRKPARPAVSPLRPAPAVGHPPAAGTSVPRSAPAPRGPRSDALRNRAALLDAARAVFRERGLAAQMDDVAARAGLGVGTLYRHFPTKEVLLDVMVRERHQTIVDAARAALRADDPWEGLTSFIWRVAEMDAQDRTIADLLLDAQGRVDPAPFYADVSQALRTLTRRAQRAGAMRRDVSGEDALTVVCSIARHHRAAPPAPAPAAAAAGGESWRRLVRVVLDGLRPPRPRSA